MSKEIEFVLELTREEAVTLCLVYGGAVGGSYHWGHLRNIADALESADIRLHTQQLNAWEELGRPRFDLGMTA